MDKLAKFETMLGQAIDRFEEQGSELKSLREAVEETVKGLKLLKAQYAFGANDPRFDVGFNDPEQAKEFIDFTKAAFTKDTAALTELYNAKDMTVGTDSEGGYLVPDDWRAVLIRLVEVYGVARQFATVIPQNRSEMVMPKLTTGVAVYWIDEAASITSTQPVFGELRMLAKKMAAIVPITSELLEDSAIGIANLLATLFAEAVAQEEDRVVLAGDVAGASDPFDGVLFESGVNEITMAAGSTDFADVTADHLADMSAQITAAASAGARWFLHRTIFNIVRKLKDSQGNYIYQAPAGNQPGTIWTYPYTLTDVMPALAATAVDTPFLAFGNLRHHYIGDRRQMTMAQSIHANFANDRTLLRMTHRISSAVAIPAAFCRLRTAAA